MTKTPALPGITPGTIIDGKYEILGLLGAGGMGEVYKAMHVHLDAVRCIKVMKKGLSQDESFRKRFLREAKTATQVNHHNVAAVYDFSALPDGSYYMVSEFVDGITLRQWATKHGRLPVGFAVEVARQTLAGLDHCHRRGLLHRDISADNIMIALDSDGHPIVKIIDLGIAKVLTAPADGATQVGLFVGNPKYSSPEQLGQLPEGEEIDQRSDLYSFGVVLYETVTGTPPFISTSAQGYVVKHLTQQPRRFGEADANLKFPAGFEDAVFKALEKDRTRRYASANEFAAALAPFAAPVSLDQLQPALLADLTQSWTHASTGHTAPPPSSQAPIATEQEPILRATQRDGQTPLPVTDTELDERAWAEAESIDSIAAYRRYLQERPQGAHVAAASRRIADLTLLEDIDRFEKSLNQSEIERIVRAHDGKSHIGKVARHALGRVQVARAAAAPKPEPAPLPVVVPAPPPPIVEPAPRRRISVRLLSIVAVALLAVVAIALVALRGDGEEEVASEESTVTETVAVTANEEGVLLIDARPWAEVTAVRNSAGKNLLDGAQQYTPLRVSVPAGKYTVEFRNANFTAAQQSIAAEVAPRQTRTAVAQFAAPDPNEYLRNVGLTR